MNEFIPQMEPWFDEKEANALRDYVLSGGWGTEFSQSERFEQLLKEFTGSKHCILTTSGTVTLVIALLALGVEENDEIIVPDLTMIATPNSAKLVGATPVFVDIDDKTLNIDITQVEESITPKTKAVIHVSYNGRSNNLFDLKNLCESKGIYLIEDAAQSLGSFHESRHLGTIGDIGSLSFSSPKIISTGQGGALLTNNDDLAVKMKKLKDFGRTFGGHDIHDEIGFNFKFTDFQSVVGIEQMKKLSWRVTRKKEIWQRYYKNLSGINKIQWIDTDLQNVTPWFIDIYIDDPIGLSKHLKKEGIGTRTVYPPIHRQKAYDKAHLSFPNTEYYASRGLWLPSSSKLSDEQIDTICSAVGSFFS